MTAFEAISEQPLSRALALTHRDMPHVVQRRIAVLELSERDRRFVCGAIRALGHEAVEFAHTRALTSVLMVGETFDLAMASFAGEQEDATLVAGTLQRIAGRPMPVLLLMRPEQLKQADAFFLQERTDFVMLPCEKSELVCRIVNALARHSRQAGRTLVFGRYEFEPIGRTVNFGHKQVRLQPRQFDLALFLFQHADETLLRETILKAVWRRKLLSPSTRTLDVHIAHLRAHLELGLANGCALLSVRGVGYRLHLNNNW